MNQYPDPKINDRFGLWIIINNNYIKKNNNQHKLFKCRCKCGLEKYISKNSLISSQSGGCRSCMNRTHDLTHHRLYKIWKGIIQRTTNVKNKSYKKYGNRGIKICNEWRKDFKQFYDWSIKNGYASDLDIDRIDNDGNYEPSNCRWVTNQENSYNRRGCVSREVSSKYKGVSWNKNRNKWIAQINKDNKHYFLGYFHIEEDAALAYNDKAQELFGEFVYLNKIIDN